MVAPLIAAGARVAAGGARATAGVAVEAEGARDGTRAARLLGTKRQPEQASAFSGKRRIGRVTAGFMVGTALLFDLTQFLLNLLPVIGQVASMYLGFFAACSFGIWFLILGVSYFKGKRAGLKVLTALSAVVVELIPIIDAVPAITLGVIVVIAASWAEDRGGGSGKPST